MMRILYGTLQPHYERMFDIDFPFIDAYSKRRVLSGFDDTLLPLLSFVVRFNAHLERGTLVRILYMQ